MQGLNSTKAMEANASAFDLVVLPLNIKALLYM